MSTRSDVLDALIEKIIFARTALQNAQNMVEESEAELADWGYTWTPETGVQKLPEGETES
jgi:hypothetical protein